MSSLRTLFLSSTLAAAAILTGCASEPYTVTLRRWGGFSGLEERYVVDQDGHGKRMTKMPVDSESNVKNYTIDKDLTRSIGDYLLRHRADLDAVILNGTGNMSSGLVIDAKQWHKEITWPNIDPPKLSTSVVDSLYQYMLQAEQQMTDRP